MNTFKHLSVNQASVEHQYYGIGIGWKNLKRTSQTLTPGFGAKQHQICGCKGKPI